MRLVRYLNEAKQRYGVLTDDRVLCLTGLAKCVGKDLPEVFQEFVSLGAKGTEKAERILEDATSKDLQHVTSLVREVVLLSPIAYPRKIVCLGLNYRDHAMEQNAALPDEPVIFMKPPTTIIGPHENILKPSFVKKLDYEAELAIVIGKKGKNIPISEAESYIFGYTILNDVSARDIQFKDIQWTRGKSFDTFAPTGPCITTANQLQDTSHLSIRAWVNDELRQDSTTQNMVFNVYETVHHLSRVMTLEPCDLIATGTPAGVGFAFEPKPKFLKNGDVVKIYIEKIGVLENTVVEEKSCQSPG